VIVFQYNPDALTRTLTAHTTGGAPNSAVAPQLKGPLQKTITVNIEIDMTDQLSTAEQPIELRYERCASCFGRARPKRYFNRPIDHDGFHDRS
jgi:hypothetical protein